MYGTYIATHTGSEGIVQTPQVQNTIPLITTSRLCNYTLIEHRLSDGIGMCVQQFCNGGKYVYFSMSKVARVTLYSHHPQKQMTLIASWYAVEPGAFTTVF
jgi:hypothetical protein